MKNMTLQNIIMVTGGKYYGDEIRLKRTISDITIDSRKVTKDCLFVPIVGERADGHDYIEQVIAAGALCTLSERVLEGAELPYILVESSLQAVKDIAEFYLAGLDIPVIGITGSVGKTSTKEMIAAILEQKYKVLKTQGNFNNELGVPLTIFNIREEDEIAVLEMGISEFGEMHRLAKVARPETCVITNIGDCHLENLKSRAGVLKAKSEIFDFLNEDGRIVLNGDDDKLSTLTKVKGRVPISYGINNHTGVFATDIKSHGLKGVSCQIHLPKESVSVMIPIPGQHMVYNALAGAVLGDIYGLKASEIKNGIESLQSLVGRFNIIETKNYTIIDDCYNANPASMKASLAILQEGIGRKVAIIGDMGELGVEEVKLHSEVGEFAASCQIDLVICVGALSKNIINAIKINNPKMASIHYQNRENLLDDLSNTIKKGDTILVKASHFMKFEEVVATLNR
jgi:UDP-N-acetylmuramoyl-tripeptide--D-alanyl-D-alanine ligase